MRASYYIPYIPLHLPSTAPTTRASCAVAAALQGRNPAKLLYSASWPMITTHPMTPGSSGFFGLEGAGAICRAVLHATAEQHRCGCTSGFSALGFSHPVSPSPDVWVSTCGFGLGASPGSPTEHTEVCWSYLHMKTWGLSPAESNQELPSGLFDYLQNNSQLQVWCVPDSHYETTLKRSTGPGFGLVCKQRQTSGGSAGWRSCIPLGPRQRGAEQPLAFWPNGAFLFFKQFILCDSSISSAHLHVQHCNRIQASF